jgi:O-antigen ligase
MIAQSSYHKLRKLTYVGIIVFSGLLVGLIISCGNEVGLAVFLGLLISISAFLFFLEKYERGWFLFSALLPFWLLGEEFRISIGTMFHPDLSMITLLLLGIAFLLFFLLKGSLKTNNIPNFWLICAFFANHVFSLFYGGVSAWGLKIIVTLAFGIFVYILMALSIKDSKLLEKMFKLIFIFATILLIFLVYKYLFVFHSIVLGNDIFRHTEQGGKSQLGLFLVVFTPLMLSYTIFHKNWVSFSGTFIFLGSLIYTVCRGAYLSILVAIIFLLMISKHRRAYLKILISAMIIISIFVTIFIPQLTFQVLEETGGIGADGLSEKDRMVWISGGLDVFFAHPIFGIGLGNFRRLWFPVPPYTECLSHNDYIQILTEQGLIGFLIFLSFLGSVLVGLIKILRRNVDNARWLQEGISASLISIIVFFLTLNFYYVLPVWYILGCSAVIFNLLKKETLRK